MQTIVSDYYFIFLEINKKVNTKLSKEIISFLNCLQMKKEATGINWLSLLSKHDPNETKRIIINR